MDYETNNYLVKDAYIVNDLLNAGYKLVCIARNKYDNNKSVYYFKPAKGLEEAVAQAYLAHQKILKEER